MSGAPGSGLRADFSLDPSDFSEEIDGIKGKWPAHRRAMLLAIAEHFVGQVKGEIPVNTGRARQSVRVLERGSDTISVVAGGQQGVDYILPLLHGSRPHHPGSSDPSKNRTLARWARRNNYPGGFQGIYWHIAREGTEEHDFVSGPMRDTRRQSGGIATQVLRNRGVLE